MTYAKLITETSIDRNPPRRATIDGRAVAGELPAEYLAALGYYPLDESAPEPQDAPEGHHYEARYAYDSDETPTRIVRSWVEVEDPPPPPRSFSKRKLYRAFTEAGVWPQIKAYMEQAGIWEDWEYATTLDEDDPLIAAAVPAIQSALAWTAEQMEAVLAASVAEVA